MHINKIIFRQQANSRINNLSLIDIHQKSMDITKHFMIMDETKKFKNYCLYCSLPTEVQTDELILYLLNKHKNVAVPKITNDNLSLHYISSLSDIRISSLGIREPNITCRPIDTKNIDVFVIPGLAFDKFGTRIGRGKGFYDKLLQDISAPKIGLAFSEQIFPLLPKNNHDIVMDIIITETQVITVNTL